MNAIVIEKYDSVTHAALPGATFQLRFLGGTSGTGGTALGQKTTGKNGTAIWTGLQAGTYIVEEIDSADGYSIIQESETVYLAADGTQSVVTVRFENLPDGNLLIRKVCAVAPSVTLQNAEFKITYADGTLIGDSNGIYRTDENGEIRIEGLTPGKSVIVTETKAPDGFTIDTQSQTIQIKGGRTVSLTFKNQPNGKLIITKVDAFTNQKLPGAEYRITTAAGCEVGLDGVIGTASLTQNGIFVTDAQGQISITNLLHGTYTITEIKAPNGYKIDTPVTNVVIAKGDTQSIIIKDSPLAALTVNKVDSVTRKPLADAVFTLKYSDGKTIGSFTTDKNGQCIASGLLPDATVIVTEDKAPLGYLKEEVPQTIVVRSGVANAITVENEPSQTLIIQKFIDGTKNEPLSGVGFKITDGSGAGVGPDGGIYYTDNTGSITLTGLEPGTTITAREFKTVDGMLLDGTPQTILIKAGEVQHLTFFNQRLGALGIRKLDSVTKKPLAGVEFQLTYADGRYVDNASGHLSSLGLYTTDSNGEIRISGVVGTIVVKETKTIDGYTMGTDTTQTVQVNADDTQTLTFYNDPIGGVEIIKVDANDKTKRLANATFEIRKMDGRLVDTVTTDKNGRVFLSLEDGSYYAVEIEAPKGYKLDSTPHYFEVKSGKSATVTVTNAAISGILIHKVDANTGKGIYGVSFLLYDGNKNPIGQYTSDNNGYVYMEDLTAGRYYVRELENEGYRVDTQLKTIYVESETTTEVEWKNTPITAQIQIIKKSADYNSTNGLPAGTLLEGAVFEIYDRANNVVDTIRSDSRGLAASKPLPLGRYTIREVKAPAYYGVSDAVLNAYLEHEGQIVTFEVTNKSLATGVSITKTGPKEIMAGQILRYAFSNIANRSNVRLDNFYWRDTLSAEVRLSKVVTGTYNFPGTYKITYRVNGGEYQTLADNLSTSKNYTLDASATALGLASGQRVTEIMFVFGQAPAGFAQVEKPYLHCTAVASLSSTSFVNIADVGGNYNGQWVQAISRWVTTIYGKPTKVTLPRTGY